MAAGHRSVLVMECEQVILALATVKSVYVAYWYEVVSLVVNTRTEMEWVTKQASWSLWCLSSSLPRGVRGWLMVPEMTVCAKTSLTFVSCYCSWTQNFGALWKFLLEVYAAHFITHFGQWPINAAGATVSMCKDSHLHLFKKLTNKQT